jgi:hypothetical protein
MPLDTPLLERGDTSFYGAVQRIDPLIVWRSLM